ncbi:YciI family protein [Dactylosporangium sp. CS-033363]|uniref:YciI family protein n=1 Tax=Dactylosporangium sp. CS-033363 TaxID=3239935 RepID=UPI003D8DE953
MWILELAFTPTEERLAARPAHRERLAALRAAGAVHMAGPLADDSGAVLLLNVPDRAAADAIIAADPYYTTDGVTIHQLREWNPLP